MAGPVKTQAVVLRSIRFGEADRIVHLYTPHRGRVGAIAKGVRRSRSRFGGRLEPFFRLALILHRGGGGPSARGGRRPRRRWGGRGEPFFRLDLILHEGRGELLTVTSAETVDG